MTNAWLVRLCEFHRHPGMYVDQVGKQSITAFIRGFERGWPKSTYVKDLVAILSDSHGVRFGPLGWPEQIDRLARRRHSTWVATYFQVAEEVLGPAGKRELRRWNRRLGAYE